MKGLNLKRHPLVLSRDTGCPAELIQHFVSPFGKYEPKIFQTTIRYTNELHTNQCI